MRLTLAVLFCTYLMAARSLPQGPVKVRAELITVDDGLPQGMVWAILQDRSGFLWFATKDGLDRFDGYEHVVFHHDPADSTSLCGDHVTSLFEDRHGRIWIGTDSKGVDRYDPATGRFTHVRPADRNAGIPTVVHIMEHPSGDIWVHSFFANVFVARAEEMRAGGDPVLHRSAEVYPGMRMDGLRDIEIAPNGDVWLLGKRSLSVYRTGVDGHVDMDTWPIAWPENDAAFFPELVFNATAQRVLLVWDHHLVRFNAATRAVVDTLWIQNIQKQESRLFLDDHDRLWGLTGDGTWFRMEMRTGGITYLQPLLDNGRALSLAWFASWAMDRMGILWCGTTGHGLVKYNPLTERFQRWTEEADAVRCTEIVRADAQGSVLLNAEEFKLLNSEGDPLQPTGLAEALDRYGLQADWKRCVRDPRGRYWFCGIRQGASGARHLYRYVPSEGSITAATDGPEDHYMNIFPGVGDAIWVTCGPRTTENDTAITRFDTRTDRPTGHFVFPGPVKGSTRRGISGWQVGIDGTLWMGSDFGVYALQPASGEWRHFTAVEGDTTMLPTEVVLSLCLDPTEPTRYIWVGTAGGGLARMDMATGRCRSYSADHGLPNNVIYGILSDAHDQLWLSTNRGLCHFDPRTGAARTYTRTDGIAGNEFNRYSAERSADGKLYFGGMEGITWFDPEDFYTTARPSSTLITGLRLMNKRVGPSTHPQLLSAPAHLTGGIVLPYHERMLTFEFACMDLSAPASNEFRYRLLGLNKAWVGSGTEHTATFTNLDPGRYEFQVQGRNSSDAWDEVGASMIVVIDPPWWGTWWFRIMALIVFAGALYAFYRFRLAQAVKVVRVRERIARDLHDEIGSTLSSVSLFSSVAQKKAAGKAPEASELLGRITESTTQVLEAMNDIVWAVNADNDDMASVIKRMHAFAVNVTEASGCKLHLHAQEELKSWRLEMSQRKNLYLIFKEAVNNAVKYSGCTNLRVELLRDRPAIVLRVSDDGKGFDTNANNGSVGGGNGLSNMRNRAAEIPGTLTIASEPGKGTTVELRFVPGEGKRSLEPMTSGGEQPQ